MANEISIADKDIRARIIDMAIACGITDDYQHEMIFDESRDIVIDKARGIGITTAVSFQKMIKILMPELWSSAQRENVIVSAGAEQARHLIDYVKHFWSVLESQFSQKLKITKDKAETSDGRWIMSLACEPDSIRTYHGDVVFDEFAYFENGLDRKFFKAVSGVQTSGGQTHYISNPNGEAGTFFDIWRDKQGIYKKYSLPYTVCKRKMYRDTVLRAKKKLFDYEFDEEYCCLFNPASRGAIPYKYIDNAVKQWAELGLKINEYRKTDCMLGTGIDFAKMVDQTILVTLEKRNMLKIPYWLEVVLGDYDEQLNYIDRLDGEINSQQVFFDKTGNVKLAEEIEKRFSLKYVGKQFTNPYKEKLFQKIKYALMDRKLPLPNDEALIRQLKGLKRKVSASGNVQYAGKEDDYVWALGLALDCIEEEGGDISIEERTTVENTKHKEANQVIRPSVLTQTGDFGRGEVRTGANWGGMFK